MVEDCERVYPWRDLIRAAALKAWIPNLVLDIPIMFEATCTLKPPKVIPKARNGYATAKPDYDKLARAIGDAITHTKKQAGIIKDDSLIIRGLVSKTYPYDRRFPDALDQPGAVIHIYPAGDYR